MITLDASVVIAFLSRHDPHHAVATSFLVGANEGFLMHPLNMAEVLVGGVRIGRERQMQQDLHTVGIHVAERPGDEPVRLATLRAHTGLKLPDCCALDTALLNGSTLATFDTALANAARDHHLAVAPERDVR